MTTTPGEFNGIFTPEATGSRPVMSHPPRVLASTEFIREVRDALHITDDDQAREAADWIADKMERLGASRSRPMFDMEGNGPLCSWCGVLWPRSSTAPSTTPKRPGRSAANTSTTRTT